MTNQDGNHSFTDSLSDAIAAAIKASQAISDSLKGTASIVGDTVTPILRNLVEQSTETVGRVVTPIAENPMVKYATKLPGVSWLMAALGQVDVAAVRREIEALRQQYPIDSNEQLAQRVIVDSTLSAAKIGLVTNFLPPLAIMLFALDLGAIAALQAEMIYRVAAIYGFSPDDPTRRGEVLAIWGITTGSSGFLKTGLSIVEIIPGIGAAVGVTTDAAILYGVGQLACRFYEDKQQAASENN